MLTSILMRMQLPDNCVDVCNLSKSVTNKSPSFSHLLACLLIRGQLCYIIIYRKVLTKNEIILLITCIIKNGTPLSSPIKSIHQRNLKKLTIGIKKSHKRIGFSTLILPHFIRYIPTHCFTLLKFFQGTVHAGQNA